MTDARNPEPDAVPTAPPTLDPGRLKALAHPLRMQLLNALSNFGPATASGLAARFGESSGATSYHLRQLERHGFVEEDHERGTARERYWKAGNAGFAIDSREYAPDSAERAAADVVLDELQRQSTQLLDDFLRHGPELLPDDWQDAGSLRRASASLTLEELNALGEELSAVVDRYVDRDRDRSDDGSRRVRIEINAFPVVSRTEGTR